ncbi:MAG: beta-agarase [Thermoprotei archaeon]|mgnify:FL=1|nr:MAG: beta-agarase [Thermoprotei archaeon]
MRKLKVYTLTVVLIIASLVIFLMSRPSETEYDEYGGWKKLRGTKTGFFHVEEINGIWWLVDPEGYVFISKGVNHINYYGDYCPKLGYSPYNRNVQAKYGNIRNWAYVTILRLKTWGFNTIGAWSSPELYGKLPYTIILDIAASYGANWLTGEVPDIFSDQFEKHAKSRAMAMCYPRRDDPYLIGYFTDNELRWGPDWRSSKHLLDDFMNLPPSSPGKRVAVEVLREVFNNNISALNELMKANFSSFEDLLYYVGDLPEGDMFSKARSVFLRKYAERYFSVCYKVIKEADPNHLILGCRFAGYAPREVLEVMKDYVDVISINYYGLEAPINLLKYIYSITKKPIMITEFSFKAMDSGLPNTKGAGIALPTQKERAEYCKRYVTSILKLPFVIGYHWFQYMDQPKEGRFDGENSNFGLVKINDEPWDLLVKYFKEINRSAERIHLESTYA